MKFCKVRGDLHLADVSTKHMPSQEKLNQLVTLFGCAFVDECAKFAPLLLKRRQDELAGKGFADENIIQAEGIDEDGSMHMLEAGKHDVERWLGASLSRGWARGDVPCCCCRTGY